MVVMSEDIDRSGLFNEIRGFSQRKLKKVETKVTTGSGEVAVEKRTAKGVQTIKSEGIQGAGYVVDHKPDLQVGMIIPGLFISSQDVAQDKSSLDTFEITHILNLAYGVQNAFEDDYNYKKLDILDTPETDIRKYFDDCYEFIDEARQRGNCLVHCNAGVSRSTAICCGYLMSKEKMTFDNALNAIREARPFSKPNDGFMKQLKEYDQELRGSGGLKEANVDDAFTARKRAEIEAEKAALKTGGSTVKNKLKQFGPQLDALFAQRAKCLPAPIKLPLKKKTTVPINDNNIRAPPPPPLPEPQKFRQEPPQRSRPELMKPEPKKLIINKEVNNRSFNDSNTSPKVDETPISVKAFRKNFEMNNKMNNEIPKLQTTPATPKTNAVTNNMWKTQTQTSCAAPEDKKKKIIIKQSSKESNEEQPKRRSTRDLADAFERANSPNTGQNTTANPTGNLPYGQRRRQTTQLDDNKPNNTSNNYSPNKSPVRQRKLVNYERLNESQAPPPPPPPPQPMSRTIKLVKQSSATPSPAASSPMSSNRNSPQPPISHSPSPTPVSQSDGEPKMVFGRVRPPRLSLTGRTLSQASQTLQDVSKANNDSTTSSLSGHSASNSRSESPVLSAVGDNRDTKTSKTTPKSKSIPSNESSKQSKQSKEPFVEPSNKATAKATTNAKPVSDNMANKWTSNASLNMTNNNNKSNQFKKSCSPSSLSGGESSDEELEEKIKPKMSSTLTSMQLKPNNNINESNNLPQNDLTLTEQPSTDNRYNSKRVPLGKTAGQQSFEKNRSGLNRSSSAAILKLIKSSTKTDIGLDRVEEDDEIEGLLMALEQEGVDNIDWDELNVDQNAVKAIIENEKVDESDSDESSDDDDDSDDEAVHMVINRQAPPQESDDEEFEVVDDEEEESD